MESRGGPAAIVPALRTRYVGLRLGAVVDTYVAGLIVYGLGSIGD